MNGGGGFDSGQIEANRSIVNGHPLIAQYTNTKSIELAQPGVRTGEIFMVARDEIDAVRSPEGPQRLNSLGQLFDGPVDEISCDGDQVRDERVGAPDDLFDEASTDGRPHVDVGELDDSKSALRGGEPVEPDGHLLYIDWFAPRANGGRRHSGDQAG